MSEQEWISPYKAAKILEVSERTIIRRLVEGRGDEYFGPGNWRPKPLSLRPDYQLRRTRIMQMAAGEDTPSK